MLKRLKNLATRNATTEGTSSAKEEELGEASQNATLAAEGVVIHIDYDADNPPPMPGPEWTRFVCISDTHSSRFQVRFGAYSGHLLKHNHRCLRGTFCSIQET